MVCVGVGAAAPAGSQGARVSSKAPKGEAIICPLAAAVSA